MALRLSASTVFCRRSTNVQPLRALLCVSLSSMPTFLEGSPVFALICSVGCDKLLVTGE